MKYPTLRVPLLAAALVALCSPAFAQPVLRIPFVNQPPSLAAYAAGAPRGDEAAISDFRQRIPGDGIPASHRTTAYLSYDRTHLYIAFVCEDDPSQLRAQIAPREQIDEDDAVIVLLDTFASGQRYYTFSANPYGVQFDSIRTEGLAENRQYETVWRTQAQITPSGYAVLFSIPFRNLRFSRQDQQQWRIALGRRIARLNEYSYWPHLSSRVEGFAQQFARLEGLENISPGRNLQLIPYGAYTNARLLNRSLPLPRFETEAEARGGLDAKAVFADALTLDLTVNPDFSQVGTNDPQVTINRRFEVFFPELRPFFLENADYFQTPLNLFFSRRIGDPRFGARLTGKAGPWSLGMLAAGDRLPAALRSGPPGSWWTPDAYVYAGRAQYEFSNQSRLGFLITGREFDAGSNRVFAADGRWKMSQTWTLTGQAGASLDRPAYSRSVSGPFARIELARSGRHFSYQGDFTTISPKFRSELGFIPRVDIRQTRHSVSYYFWPLQGPVQSFGPSLTLLYNLDHTGRLQDKTAYADFMVNLYGTTTLRAGRYEAYEFYWGKGYRYGWWDVGFYSAPAAWLSFYGTAAAGSGLNYSPPQGLDPFLGRSLNLSTGLSLRPSARFRIDPLYLYNRFALDRGLGSAAGTPASGPVFNTHQARLKAAYQFTREVSLRLILDYEATLPNSAWIAATKQKSLRGDYLFTYLLHPGTVVYVGYTDRLEDFGLLPGGQFGALPSPSSRNARQFYVKLSYLFAF
jgi:hypothetical protein